jgi:hypothetical protein
MAVVTDHRIPSGTVKTPYPAPTAISIAPPQASPTSPAQRANAAVRSASTEVAMMASESAPIAARPKT